MSCTMLINFHWEQEMILVVVNKLKNEDEKSFIQKNESDVKVTTSHFPPLQFFIERYRRFNQKLSVIKKVHRVHLKVIRVHSLINQAKVLAI